MTDRFPRIAQFKTTEQFRARLSELGLSLPVDDALLSAQEGSPLAQPIWIGQHHVGNRWCIQPMEGWDANRDGSPSELTLRRWRNFGASGAKLIWGGEAAAVRADGRANPRQTMAIAENRRGLTALRDELLRAHAKHFATTDDLLVGLQLTHSGRFCRPDTKQLVPRIAYRHPLLDAKFGIDASDERVVLSDDDVWRLIDDFLAAARLTRDVGFSFVDVKACHGYLLHEFLSARSRPGPFGGDLPGRARVLETIIGRIRDELPGLTVVVRLSAFDMPPFELRDGEGHPMRHEQLLPYRYAFGCREDNPLQRDLGETVTLVGRLQSLGVAAVNLSCGSPYYNPHIQRPAAFPPSDGYPPPEDPLIGVVRQIDAVRECKAAFPRLPIVGTGYSYLQDYLPHVAQAVVRAGWTDLVGLGRMVLSYPELPADTLAGRPLQRKRLCRTFSDCTTAPRNGLESGCYPLDPFYKALPQAVTLRAVK